MITKLTIENFKCFGDRVEIPIKPITLLFGGNSAGKSTIIQAFHYVREILEHNNLDADKLTSGGDFIDLGGFKNFVHNHDISKDITFRFDMESQYGLHLDFEEYFFDHLMINIGKKKYSLIDIFREFERKEEESCWVEFTISMNQNNGKPYVYKYSSGINGQLVAELFVKEKGWLQVQNINTSHPIYEVKKGRTKINLFQKVIEKYSDPMLQSPNITLPGSLMYSSDISDALPSMRDTLFIGGPEDMCIRTNLSSLLGSLLFTPCDLLRQEINKFRYIGPLRKKPERNHTAPKLYDVSRWTTGLAAWDYLYEIHNGEPPKSHEPMPSKYVPRKNKDISSEINRVLSDLEVGYQLHIKEILEIENNDEFLNEIFQQCLTSSKKRKNKNSVFDSEFVENTDNVWRVLSKRYDKKNIISLINNAGQHVSPQDVGEGISQVLPIIVSCLDRSDSLNIIEQPELHLHPKQQAELADVVVKSFRDHRKPFLMETHSQHLVLRMLRRIREANHRKTGNKIKKSSKKISTEDVAVLYINQDNEGSSKVYEMEVDDRGEFLVPWPDTFFDQNFIERFSS